MVFLLVAAAKCSSKELWKVSLVLNNAFIKTVRSNSICDQPELGHSLLLEPIIAQILLGNQPCYLCSFHSKNNIDNGVIFCSMDSLYIYKTYKTNIKYSFQIKRCVVIFAFCFLHFLSVWFLFICPDYIQMYLRALNSQSVVLSFLLIDLCMMMCVKLGSASAWLGEFHSASCQQCWLRYTCVTCMVYAG